MYQDIERIPFGKTGHKSSRAIFGAAALGAMKQDRADRTLELIQEWGLITSTWLRVTATPSFDWHLG